jgi:nicotinate-nucleotide--dimethylbenzimidazole phosphoribosyltransferase
MSIITDDRELDAALRSRWDQKTKPPGSLGRIEEVGIKYGLLQKSLRPACQAPLLLIFAADHGVAKDGVSAYPQSVTGKMVHNFLDGTAAATIMAERLGADWRVVDCGVDGEFSQARRLIQGKIAHGTKNLVHESAMTREQAEKAFRLGRELVLRWNLTGSNTFFLGEMGIGNTSSAALITHRLTGAPLDQVVGRGSGLTDEGWARKKVLLGRAAARSAGDDQQGGSQDPWETLAQFGGFEIAAMVGAFVGCHETRSMAVADGFISSVAALVAVSMNSQVLESILWSHLSAEPGHRILLEFLGQTPLFSLGLRLGEGTGALLSLPLIHCALDLMAKMARMTDFQIEPSPDSLAMG